MNALGLLGVVFAVMSLAAIVFLVLLFVMKDEKKKKYIVGIMAIFGLYIAWANGQSSPLPDYLNEAVFGWIIGLIGVVGFVLQMIGKSKNQLLAAKICVVISIVVGMIGLAM